MESDQDDYAYDHDDDVQEEEEYSYSDGEDESPAPPTQVMPSEGYKIIDSDELRSAMTNLVTDISGVLDLHPFAAAALLRHNNWNKEAVIDSFCTDADKAKCKAGILHFVPNFRRGTERKFCRICCEECAGNDVIALGCGHFFCRPCYAQYLTGKLEEGLGCCSTRCPEFKCDEIVTENHFQALLPQDKMSVYHRFNLKTFVDMSANFRWCPGRGCDSVAMGSSSNMAVRCKCGTLFCFKCGEESHVPATCDDMTAWGDKCRNESETANWILANTRKCPKCMTRIEKNQGCNHMTCKSVGCGYEFCWICMGPWSEHGANTGGYYKCNKYDPQRPTKDEMDGQKAKAELDRYLHYYKRYDNHNKAQLYAEKQQEETERRMMRLQETDGSRWIDVQFLKSAMEVLIECRRVLKYTYVFGFYLADGTARKRLFEHHQENLEKFTEHLSELSELDLEQFKEAEKRAEVVNYTRVTETFLKNLLRSVEEGLETAEDDHGSGHAGAANAHAKVKGGPSAAASQHVRTR